MTEDNKLFNIHKEFATDEKLELDGVWVELNAHGSKIRVARAGNKNFKRAYNALSPAIQRQMRNSTLSEKTSAEITARLMANHVLMAWEGIADEAGKPLIYSPQVAYDFLLKYPDFRQRVFEESQVMEYFRTEEIAADAKNSSPLSSSAS